MNVILAVFPFISLSNATCALMTRGYLRKPGYSRTKNPFMLSPLWPQKIASARKTCFLRRNLFWNLFSQTQHSNFMIGQKYMRT